MAKMPKARRILVCGSRDYSDADRVAEVLDTYWAKWGSDIFIISGGATGADTLAREWAVERRVDHITLFARWHLHGRAAGPIRNRAMAKLKPELVIAFHPEIDKSKGTRDMIGVANSLDIQVKRFR